MLLPSFGALVVLLVGSEALVSRSCGQRSPAMASLGGVDDAPDAPRDNHDDAAKTPPPGKAVTFFDAYDETELRSLLALHGTLEKKQQQRSPPPTTAADVLPLHDRIKAFVEEAARADDEKKQEEQDASPPETEKKNNDDPSSQTDRQTDRQTDQFLETSQPARQTESALPSPSK
eukprot:CAMPEP_0118890286 /NCGR_PEP_ID=MMETSP1166-20130328/825_1 /TAXON_ID=1104430 /ORGANISM="Chrysoreinhardia sp, Strain CCMP3193" /LENGTH=174 /DNA_ID=CAMNT_0006828899 /DNA_START=14 /DNA_END=538 /DNA_ORIENTATION=-